MVEEEVVPGDMVMTTIALDLHPTHHIWEVEGGGYSGGAPAGGDYDRSYGGSRRSRSRSPGRDR